MEWNPGRTASLQRPVTLAQGEPFLPLSWSVETSLNHPRIQRVALPGQIADWLAFGAVPPDYGPRQLAHWLQQTQSPHPFVLRGSHPALLSWLQAGGGQILLTGREALLNLRGEHLSRRSLRHLARRGRRHGSVLQWQGQSEHLPAAEDLLERVRKTYLAPLSYLYRGRLSESERFFALRGPDSLLGMLSIIPNGPSSWHTELLVRDPQAPVGVMEALIEAAFETLRDEGYSYWSLGEVPFYPTSPPANLKTLALTEVGQRLDRAYSASGLYAFKAKFHPIWRPVCVYGWPSMSWLTLAGMFWRCNGHKLVGASLRMLGKRG